jgi:hypothetical protein
MSKPVVAKKRDPRPGEGRPSKYKEEYCDMLIEHMTQGMSFESFAGVIGTHDETLRNWAAKYPEFFAAKKIGYAKNQIFWEKLGLAGAAGKVPGFNSASWIFNMKNRFRWADRVDTNVNHSGAIDVPTINFIVEAPLVIDEKKD